MHVIADFDRTLTKGAVKGDVKVTSIINRIAMGGYLDKDYNVNTKLNYDLQTVHQLGRIADTMRQKGYGKQLPKNLTDKELSNPDRKRLSQNEAIGELVMKTLGTDKIENMQLALQLLKQAEAEQMAWSGRLAN